MYQPIEADVSPTTKPVNKKSSFMVEDILRSTHASITDATDNSSSQQLKTERPYHQDKSSAVSSKSNTAATLSPDQQHHLEKVFRLQQYLGTKERQRLAATIRATDQQVKMWFQNKRMMLKLQIDKAQHRQAKLAYLNSLAQSLLNNTAHQPSLSPTIVKPLVRKCSSHSDASPHVPYRNYDHLTRRYSTLQRVTPYSWNQYRYTVDCLPHVVRYHPRAAPYFSWLFGFKILYKMYSSLYCIYFNKFESIINKIWFNNLSECCLSLPL